jgi:hypothetical protein
VVDIRQDMAVEGLAFQNQPSKKTREKKSVFKKAGNLCKGDRLRFEVLTVVYRNSTV